jgi:hypothetical protein
LRSESRARAYARLGVAVTRGLLLDLLATQDVAGVDAAMEAFISLGETWPEREGTPADGPRSDQARSSAEDSGSA